jgi:membrane protein
VIEKIERLAAEIWRLLKFPVEHFFEDSCQTTAAALTYQTLFAVVPALTMMYWGFSNLEAFGGMGRTVEDFVFSNIVPENVGAVQGYIRQFSEGALKLRGPSAIFLAFTAFLMLLTIERTFNEIWRIKEPRQGFQRMLMYWAVLTLGPLLIVVGFGITTYVASLPLISEVAESPYFLRFIPMLMSASAFTLIYFAVPGTRVPFKHAVIGGVLVASVFEAAKLIFALVMSKSSFQAIYGTFAVVPLFLLWIYISWTIVLVGAELVKGLGVYRYEGSAKLEQPFFQLLIVLEVFNSAHHRGEVVTDKMIHQLGSRINMEKWTEYRHVLMSLNLIRSVDRGGLILARDLSEITIWELHRLLPWPLPGKSIDGNTAWERSLSETFESISGRNQEALSIDLESVYLSK